MKKLVLIFITSLTTSCSTIGSYVEGWPELNTTVHTSSLLEINQKCWDYFSTFEKVLGAVSFGCTIYDLDKNTCDVYLLSNSPEFITKHELAHCKGGDHPNGNLKEIYDRWLDMNLRISNHYDDEPPLKLIDENGAEYWDHSYKFSVIPPELFALGQQQCAILGNNVGLDYQAIGYHPLAQNSKGETLIGGGYFCIPK